MTRVTSPQQTDRRGTDEIPGQRGAQGVRLLVLGSDTESQDLRERAAAAGFELAQRYSARVSHVAYGTGIDPEDVRYTKIRDAGLALLPLQKCAEQLGLRAETAATAETAETAEPTEPTETAEVPETLDAEPEVLMDDEPLEIPPLHPVAEDVFEGTFEAVDEAVDEAGGQDSATNLVPGFDDEPAGELTVDPADLALAAAVIGADPWTGPKQTSAAAPAETPITSASADAPDTLASASAAQPEPRSGAGHVLFSLLWALIPFATFGLLTPVTFGYAAYRLRSRALALASLGYTLAVILSFVLSAARPHSDAPSNATGALLTIALAGAWIGGTLHGLGIRTRVFAR